MSKGCNLSSNLAGYFLEVNCRCAFEFISITQRFFYFRRVYLMTQKLLTVKEVSQILDLKPARIYELTREKKLPFVQIGERQYRYSETALTNWIENGGNQVKQNASEN